MGEGPYTKGLWGLMVIVAIVSGCATTMSLEEAKKVSLKMSGTSFTPPPRRINDILAILGELGQFDPAITRNFKTETEKKPPVDAGHPALANFYYARGEAYRRLGQNKKALDDLRKALEHSQQAGIGGISGTKNAQLMLFLGQMEKDTGNFQRAMELFKKSIQTNPSITGYAGLMNLYVLSGDYEKAWQVKEEGIQFYYRVMAGSRRSEAITWAKSEIAWMEALSLEAQGRFKEAERYRRERLAAAETMKIDFPHFTISVRGKLADNLLNQGRLFEAELESRLALRESLGHAGKDSTLTAGMILTVSNILLAQGRLDEAERLVRANIVMLKTIDISRDSKQMADSQMQLGNILFAKRSFIEAMAEYDLARVGLRENDYLFEKRYAIDFNLMITLIKAGRSEEAMKSAFNAYALYSKTFGAKDVRTAQALGIRAMTYTAAGELRKALDDYLRAVPILMGHMLDDPNASLRKQRINLIVESFIDLLARIHGTALEKESAIDAAGEAFRHVNMLAARSVQTALGSNIARAAVTDAGLEDLVRKGQDLEMQINVRQAAITNIMETSSEGLSPGQLAQMHENLETLNNARKTILDEIKRLFPKYSELVNPQASNIDDVKGVLRTGEVLVSIYPSESKTYVWAIPKQGKVLFHAAPLGRKELEKIVTDLRKALDANPLTFGDIPDFDTALAYHLYAELLKPVEMGWESATDLIVVTSGTLGQIPLYLLPTDPVDPGAEKDLLFSRYRLVPWLIRKVSVTSVPSVSSLLSLRTVPAGDPKRKAFIGFGDPVFNRMQLAQHSQAAPTAALQKDGKGTLPLMDSRGVKVQVRGSRMSEKGNLDKQEIISSQISQLQRLPDTAEEIRSIAQTLKADMARDVFLDKEATEHRIKTMDLADRKIIAFATHALVPGDLDGLDQPALALSSPEVTGEKEDGLLTMGEILKLKLNADWVILSACNTGASQGAGQETISGLGRAFFYAGTRSLLVTLWPIETTSAKKLVMGVFEAQNTDDSLSRSQALRKSMLSLLDNEHVVDPATGKAVASYAHPLFWAPFNIVGETGGK